MAKTECVCVAADQQVSACAVTSITACRMILCMGSVPVLTSCLHTRHSHAQMLRLLQMQAEGGAARGGGDAQARAGG